MFRKDFGSDLYLVKTTTWSGNADSVYEWCAAFTFAIHETAGIGPGYDHRAVPGRTPLVRTRDNGGFYSLGWERLLKMDVQTRPFLVHLETWNEFHEGTDICESQECGTQYMELTNKYAKMFHGREQIQKISVVPKYPEPFATPDMEFGIIAMNYGEPWDGPTKVIEIEDNGVKTNVWTTLPPTIGDPNLRFFYFDVDPTTFMIEPALDAVELTVVYRLGPHAPADSFAVQYDSYHPDLKGLDQYFRSIKPVKVEHKEGWNIAVFRLPEPRFSNRTHCVDFRLSAEKDEIMVKKISLRAL
jgi:hypothetical protein